MRIIFSLNLISIFVVFTTYAQKPPNIQQNSLRAPADIKIDGKATEWKDKFQAYNRATDIFYTICNDDENLYLAIQASEPDVLTKITNRGIVFSINTSGMKKDENAVSITYPVFDFLYGNKPFIRFANSSMYDFQRLAMEQNPDSVSKVANKKLHASEKFVRINGIPGVDTLLSIYNQQGIKVAEAFDNKMAYSYELALPLKYLNMNKASKFVYHIMLPGIDVYKDLGYKFTKRADGAIVASLPPGGVTVQASHLPAVTSTTDFWGEYVLTKEK